MGKKVILGKNDFKSICIKEDKEYLLTEWSYEKNTFMPTEISYGSNNKIWWLCPNCNNEYHATVYHRLEGTGCPKCSYKERVKTRIENRIKNKNTFGDKHPELLNEWDYEKNKGIDPYTIAPNYTKNVWWKCMKGHSWQAITPNRIKGRGCPYCSNKKIVVGENDFASEHPELLSEWDYERNEILPTQITSGSMKQVYWKCYKGHSWKCAIPTRKISGCPYCGNKKIIVGENDLATTNPELLSEWDYDKNDKAPQEVVRGSDYYAWWKCENGHTWRAKITNRVHGTSCPICKKYMRTSFFEQAIFYYVHKTYPDTINTYNDQGFEIDIYIPSIKIGIEYDGQKWHKNIENDIRKNMKCKKNGIRLIRIREKGCPAVDDSFDTCIFMDNNHEKEFERCLIKLLKILSIDSIDVNLNRDRQKIYENYIFEIRQNSIGIKIPQLVKEWHPTKNGLVTPYMLPCGTQKKVWWMCAKGHEWQSSVYSRTSRSHSGCPVCSNKKIITGINDLTTIAPEILEFWDYEKNSILPSECYLWRNKKFWWKCDEGHTWEDTPYAVRKNQNPCPICGGRKLLSGYNDFATIHKNGLLKEWNYEKNILDPSQILPGINDKVWWRCSKCGYSFK